MEVSCAGDKHLLHLS